VLSVYPFATRYALLKTKENMEGVMLKGLDNKSNSNSCLPFYKPEEFRNCPIAALVANYWSLAIRPIVFS